MHYGIVTRVGEVLVLGHLSRGEERFDGESEVKWTVIDDPPR